ncbi:hypothetical protein AMAG_01911 [Allomyces macrogynus ATCC 38327]|uniref:Uncharacterized protein n=1 Tax=Allomyces macrogynus (strain ATCC 38327) TaxID=578462 RepID=A0A0L0S134_ALLM3|nr:hypothetical protein AMAG_01911 [Allomyces macrogynus ATCC 38327]|eukprot:KNE56069.1 hypothetical protein AMAG_01911 [Allomyces macrogynus ATCC 38327]
MPPPKSRKSGPNGKKSAPGVAAGPRDAPAIKTLDQAMKQWTDPWGRDTLDALTAVCTKQLYRGDATAASWLGGDSAAADTEALAELQVAEFDLAPTVALGYPSSPQRANAGGQVGGGRRTGASRGFKTPVTDEADTPTAVGPPRSRVLVDLAAAGCASVSEGPQASPPVSEPKTMQYRLQWATNPAAPSSSGSDVIPAIAPPLSDTTGSSWDLLSTSTAPAVISAARFFAPSAHHLASSPNGRTASVADADSPRRHAHERSSTTDTAATPTKKTVPRAQLLEPVKLGGLPINRDAPEFQERLQRVRRARSYGHQLRMQHSTRRPPGPADEVEGDGRATPVVVAAAAVDPNKLPAVLATTGLVRSATASSAAMGVLGRSPSADMARERRRKMQAYAASIPKPKVPTLPPLSASSTSSTTSLARPITDTGPPRRSRSNPPALLDCDTNPELEELTRQYERNLAKFKQMNVGKVM